MLEILLYSWLFQVLIVIVIYALYCDKIFNSAVDAAISIKPAPREDYNNLGTHIWLVLIFCIPIYGLHLLSKSL